MRLKTFLPAAVLTFLMIACHDDEDVAPAVEPEFVPGQVVIGIKSTIPISSVFDLMNENELPIDQMSGFFNYSSFSGDSLSYVINGLKDKVYLNKRGFAGGSAFVSVTDHRIIVTQFFFEMDLAAQTDWLATMETLKLNDLGNDTKNLTVIVTPGTEKQWMLFFKSHPYVTWVELNYIGGFEPL